MKAKNLMIGMVILLLISVGVNVYQGMSMNREKTTNANLAAEVTQYENLYSPIYQYFTALTVEEFKQKVASGQHFTVYIGRPDCGDCNAFEPLFEQVIQDNHLDNKLYYLNVKRLREADKEGWNKFKAAYGFTQTPAFSTYENGKQKSMIEWSDKGLPRTKLEAWFKTQGII